MNEIIISTKVVLPLTKSRVWLATIVLGSAGSLVARPSEGNVTAGSAGITQSGSATTIRQNSDRAIIDWKSFSISGGEKVTFVQPSRGAAVLNRVSGLNATSIDGTLSANGQVFLINPNGIVIGSGGVIRTNSFVASTGSIPDPEFLAGKDIRITGANGGISNSGRIIAKHGDVVLAAREISNAGSIRAGGAAALAGGTEVLLTQAGDGHLSVRVKGGGTTDQSGTITATRVELKAAGGNAYGLAINHDGVSRATGAVKSGGRIILTGGGGGVRVGGTLKASNGGRIDVTGKSVQLAKGAVLDASGSTRGGTIRVGGGFAGKEEDVTNADEVVAEKGASLNADALDRGTGGRIAVWSEISTRFAGAVSAQGAGPDGSGGFAEISSAGVLDFTGDSNLAGSGRDGTLLLDPTDLTIGAPQAAAIVSSLGTGNVVVATSGTGTGAGNLTINSAISYTSANDLLFLAHGNVRANASVKNAGNGDLTVIAGWDGTTGAAGNVDGAGFKAIPGSYGNNGGSIFVGSATRTTATEFGSRNGNIFMGASGVTVAGGNIADAYSQIGWSAIDQGKAYAVGGNIELALKGDLTLQGGAAAQTQAQIGHGGTKAANQNDVIDGTFSGNITATVAGATVLNGGSATKSNAQIGHGGYTSRGSKSGNIALDTGSLILRSPNSNYSYTQIGHGGFLSQLDQNYSGALQVISAGNISMIGGGAFDAFSQIGHGGRGTAGAAPVTFTGDIQVTGQDLSMTMVASGTSHVQIGNGGVQAAGNHGGNISVNVRDLTMTASGQHSMMQIGNGGSDGNLTGDIDVSARDLTLLANNNNGTSAQIGLAGSKGNMTGKTTVTARDIVLRAGGSSAWARIGMGLGGGNTDANASGDIVVNGRNLTMVGGNSFSSPAKIGHGRAYPGIMQGDITVTVTGETSLERNPNGSGATISHITTTQTGGVLNSDWSVTTGTMDQSSTATATGVTLDSYLASVFAEAGQFGNATLTATGLNGNDGQLTVQSNYTGFSPYTVTFASTRDMTINSPVTFQANWVGNIRLLFGQLTGGTLRLNAAVSTPGTGVASAMGGAGDDNVIFGTAGSIEGLLDGGGGLNTLTGDSGNNAFAISGTNRGTLVGKAGAGWQDFHHLSGEGGNDSFTLSNIGSVGGIVSGGTGSNTLTGDNDGNLFTITGADSGLLEGKTTGWNGIQTVNGGTGSDRFIFGQDGSISLALTGAAGNDTLQLADGGNPQVLINGVNSGIYSPKRGVWSGIENLTGGDGNDLFVFTNAGRIDGEVTGGGGSDILRGDDDGNPIVITGTNSGTLAGKTSGWTGIATLEGGAAADSFLLTAGGSLSGALKGAGGIDSLTGNDLGSSFVIAGVNAGSVTGLVPAWTEIENLSGGAGDDVFRFTGDGLLSGALAGGVGNDTMQLADGSKSQVLISGVNSGTYNPKLSGGWTGIENLTGGSGDNHFVFANGGRLDGTVTGGGGSDILQGDDDGNHFTTTGANRGTLAGKTSGWSGIATLAGGAAGDGFLFATGGSLSGGLFGGGGNDTIYAGSGNDLFIISGPGSGSAGILTGSWSNIENLAGEGGDDVFRFTNVGFLSGNIYGGPGRNRIEETNKDSEFTITGTDRGQWIGRVGNAWLGIQDLSGGDGNDIFRFSGGRITGRIDGGSGWNSIISGAANDDSFKVTGLNSGDYAGGTEGWSNVSSLSGGDGDDVFEFTAEGSLDMGRVVGGNGNNTLKFSGSTGRTVLISGMDSGSVGGVVDSWNDIRSITGGGGADRFEVDLFGGLTGTLSGGGGEDTLATVGNGETFVIRGYHRGSISGAVEDWRDISNLEGSGSTDFFEIEQGGAMIGRIDGGGGDDILTLHGSGPINVDGFNTGKVPGSVDRWKNIGNLTAGVVRFKGVGSVSGLVDGGPAGGLLDYSKADTAVVVDLSMRDAERSGLIVDLATGSASRAGGVLNISKVTGGAFDDRLTGRADTQLLTGGRGDDLFTLKMLDENGSSPLILGDGGVNQLTIDTSGAWIGSNYRIFAGQVSRSWDSGSQSWSFDSISRLRLFAGDGADRVETSGFSFTQDLDGGYGARNQLVLAGPGYGLVDPASPVQIDSNGLITHRNFGSVDVVDAATPVQVRDIISTSFRNYDLSGRSDTLRFLWFLDSRVQAEPRGGFRYVDKHGKPIEIMAGAAAGQ